MRPLAAAFRMDARERDFLQVLVEMEKASDPEQRVAAMEKWLALKGPRRETVDKDRFAFFDHWYHLVLHEDFSALTLSLSPDEMKKAGEEIAQLRKRLLPIAEKDREQNHVYQCLFQMFPVTNFLEVSRD